MWTLRSMKNLHVYVLAICTGIYSHSMEDKQRCECECHNGGQADVE